VSAGENELGYWWEEVVFGGPMSWAGDLVLLRSGGWINSMLGGAL